MSEQIQDQISAFVDDELSSEECAFFVRRLQRDPEAAHRALRFSVIGAALRGEMIQPDPGVLLRRVGAALDGTVAHTGAGRRRPAASRTAIWRPVLGVAISAGVAAAAVLMLRGVNMAGDIDGGGPAAPLQASQPVEPASYVVPQEPASNQMISSPIRLTNYLMHHGAYASRLGRTIVNSNVVVSVDDPVDADFEEASTDAEAAPRTAEEGGR